MDPHAPLQQYNWLESYCRLLQHDVMGGHFRSESFVSCAALSHGVFALLTHAHLVCVLPEQQNKTLDEAEVSYKQGVAVYVAV